MSDPRPQNPDGARGGRSAFDRLEEVHQLNSRILLPEQDPESHSPTTVPDSELLALLRQQHQYEVRGEIARGGMGVVLRAFDRDLGREVAMKVLHEDLRQRPELLQRFVEEAQIGGQLQHPGVVPVYEIGLQADDRPYFTMKLIKGRTMATLLAERHGPKDERARFLSLFERVCETIAYAHSRHVIHRDLKPSNIMIGSFGEVQVVDWGFAKVLAAGGAADEVRASEMHSQASIIETIRSDGLGTTSIAGSVLGTLAYMPPEQALGRIDLVDERSDVFALGAVLCEILSGKPPYIGEDQAIQAAHCRTDDAFERLRRANVDEDIAALIRQCLNSAKAARPHNASKVAERVHEIVSAGDKKSRDAEIERVRSEESIVAERRSRKLTAGLAGSILVTITAVGFIAWWFGSTRSEAAARNSAATSEQIERTVALHERAMVQGAAASLWEEALSALRQAEAIAQAGDVDAETTARLATVHAALDRDRLLANEQARSAEVDSAMLAQLILARTPKRDDLDRADFARRDALRRDRELEAAFRGFALDTTDPASPAIHERVKKSGIRRAIIAALDDWALALRACGTQPERATALIDLSNAADDSEWRSDVRRVLRVPTSTAEDVRSFVIEKRLEQRDMQSLLLLGRGLEAVGSWDDAVTVYRIALRGAPRDPELRLRIAAALLQVKPARAGEATEHFGSAVALEPTNLRARALVSTEVPLGFVADEPCVVSTSASPQSFAEARRGVDAAGLGNWDTALSAFESATQLEPGLAAHRANLARALRAHGRLDEAQRAAEDGLHLDADSYECRFERARVWWDRADLDAAASEFEVCTRVRRSAAVAWYDLGLCRAALKQHGAAVDALEIAADLEPTWDDAFFALHLSWHHLERPGTAAEQAAVDAVAAAAQARCVRLAAEGRQTEALAAVMEALAADPWNKEANDWAPFLIARYGDGSPECIQAGLRSARRAVAMTIHHDGRNASYDNNVGSLACALYRADRLRPALELMRRSGKNRNGGDPDDWCFFAMIHQRDGDPIGARQWYDLAVQGLGKTADPIRHAEIERSRAEAAHVLGIVPETRR